MNNERRKAIRGALELLEQAKDIIETVAEEERAYYDNMPEGIQASEKGEKAEENASALDDALNNIDEAIENVSHAIE
jgi:hypothetical protein